MTRIQKSKAFSDSLVLSDGDKEIQIDVKLDLYAAASKYRRCQVAIIDAKKKAEENPRDTGNLEAYGKAIYALLELLFGRENTEKMIGFYEDNWAKLLVDITPYIVDTIYPALEEERKRQFSNAKKARRSMR